ncbi:MAG: hypothetical protein QOH93_1056 [Chloroflexia bacterium]|jgi:hypothetical protein|nr:hypothetical protein [Chloroflexia bacterium]
MVRKFRSLAITSTAMLVLSLPLLPSSLVGAQPAMPAPKDPGCRTFPETGKQACGRFLEYWDSHGGLAQLGYPISNSTMEASPIDGKSYNVQYFERAVFEYHPENKQPYDVLLSLLGSMSYKARYPNGAPNQKVSAEPGAVKFAETGHTAGGKFLRYWQEHGGLGQQGFPISEEFTEVSDLDGKTYNVQYFERAVFEYHPELAGTPYEVLLSQLGTIQFRAKYPNGEPGTTPQPGTPLPEGVWGGNHLQLTVHQGGAELEFDCAHASVPQTLLVSNNTVDAAGTFVREHGGPIRDGEPQDAHPMRILGTLNGNTLSLTVVLLDTKQELGTYVLTFGKQGMILKCL